VVAGFATGTAQDGCCVNLPQQNPGDRLMVKMNPFQFIQEVRHEVSKVTWPTWKEVWITTLMVLVMVTLAAIFFLFADMVIGWLVKLVLGLGS
jgi:preprotein translocase subunit SecE